LTSGIFPKIRGDISQRLFITGVNVTGDKLFASVNNTSNKFIACAGDNGD
jgi:hypothetical protein